MRADLSTIQQTLTPEAAAALDRSIEEAAKRRHGQTTPLHVAASLLAAPSGLLRRACARSHPQSAHPLQCRALELCFSVALDRLPSSCSSTSPGGGGARQPPVSNALMAALKRSQAHQRRGCPESQQQPLLAVKVELEQLVLSILDDPSVSRVMREASFSSTAVKSTIEQSLSSCPTPSSSSPLAAASAAPANLFPAMPNSQYPVAVAPLGLNLAPRPAAARNLYLNPGLHPHPVAGDMSASQRTDEDVKKVFDVLLRPNKHNPVLVGDSDPDDVLKKVLQKIQAGDAQPPLRAVQVVFLEKQLASVAEKSQIPKILRELGTTIENGIRAARGGVVLDVGDLKWLVEGLGAPGALLASSPIQPQPVVSDASRAAVVEMGRLVKSFGGEGSRFWMVGTASCATYLRCQVYYPAIEADWDFRAVPITRRSTLPNMIRRPGHIDNLGLPADGRLLVRGFLGSGAAAIPPPWPAGRETEALPRTTTMCPLCTGSYERELAKLVGEEYDRSSKTEPSPELPRWLQLCSKSVACELQPKDQELSWRKRTEELQQKWRETCSRLHPSSSPALSMPSAVLASRPPLLEPRLTLSRCATTLNTTSRSVEKPVLDFSLSRSESPPPGSPVKTDLVLGPSKLSEKVQQQGLPAEQRAKIAGVSDMESFKRLFKRLAEKVSWQQSAAAAVAAVVVQCRSGEGQRRGLVGPARDTWLLFVGPDRVGKRKMAAALSELMFSTGPVVVSFGGAVRAGDHGEPNRRLWGKTSLNRVAEAIRQSPLAVVVFEDVDQADAVVRGTIRRAMERGRLPDSHGREVSLGNAVFILTAAAACAARELDASQKSLLQSEERILASALSGGRLELSVQVSAAKHRTDYGYWDEARPTKLRKDTSSGGGGGKLSLDLNLAVGSAEEAAEGSWNSSDLTVEHEQEKGRLAITSPMPSPPSALLELVDDAIAFQPVDFAPLRKRVVDCVSSKFAAIMGERHSVTVDDNTVDQMVGGAWLAGAKFEDWAEKVLVPSIEQLKRNLRSEGGRVLVRLSAIRDGAVARDREGSGDGLPATVTIAVNGV